MGNKYAFNIDVVFYQHMKNYTIADTVVENFSSTLETLINKEKENKELSNMLIKSREIYRSVLKVTNNEVNFEIIRIGNIHQIIINTLTGYFCDPLTVKENIQYINENSNDPNIKTNVAKIKLALLYDHKIPMQDYKNLMMDFVYEKKAELSEFNSYVTEIVYKIEKTIQEKISYIGSKKHLMDYMERNNKLLFKPNYELDVA